MLSEDFCLNWKLLNFIFNMFIYADYTNHGQVLTLDAFIFLLRELTGKHLSVNIN